MLRALGHIVGLTGFIALNTLASDLPANQTSRVGWVDQERLMRADSEPQNWLTTGRDFGEQHYSPLRQIDAASVSRLGFAWEYDASTRRGRVQRGLEATPIVVDGVMYTSGGWGVVYALDAATGKELWRFDPELDGARARMTCCDVVNRGVAVWKGRVYVAQLDGILVALNAVDGAVLWKADTFIDRQRGYTITGAPRIAGDKVIIGNGGAEFGVRGYITAYDINSGEQRWRFFTVPGDPKKGYEHPELERAAKTWDPDANWAAAGGGTAWDSMVYDPQLNLFYVGTGNGSPHPAWLRSLLRRDNLYLSSILAINPDTGRLVWHYQVTPGDSWDYTATQPMILADLSVRGVQVPVLMQAPKNGFFYVLDRRNGKLLSAEKYVTATWAERIDSETGRPVMSGQGDYSKSPKLIYPSPIGGHNWQPMAYSRDTGLVYLPVLDNAVVYQTHKNWRYRLNDFDWGSTYDALISHPADEQKKLAVGQPPMRYQEFFLAWDPKNQREVWRAPLTGSWNGGALATAGGLVVQGTASGHLRVYNASTGKLLKEIFVGTGMIAAPMSYAVNGVQYIAIMAGYGGAMQPRFVPGVAAYERSNRGRILAFRLDGGDTPVAEKLPPDELQPPPKKLQVSPKEIETGSELFLAHCARCHGGGLKPFRAGYPDLFNMNPATHGVFDQIVLDGIFSYGGMASFSDLLSKNDVRSIHAYLIDTQHRLRAGEDVTPNTHVH
ncbi:MAG: PQQ-dependent dehydrogenase, methanol/ethanol family [Spongiibacteraceae bacterium]